MNDSFHIGRIFGIDIRVHVLFLVLLLLLLYVGGPTTLRVTLALFALVLLHELGHSLVARRFGVRVLDITFWPLGGMARMSEIPEDSRVEGWIAIAGPAVNFALAGLALPFVLFGEGLGAVPLDAQQPVAWLPLFVWGNLALGGFNLLPAFPMDGGRVLRALLARNGDWLGATERAVRVGRMAAIAMVLAGPLVGNCFLSLIGIFIWWMGTRELWVVRLRHARASFPFGPLGAGGPVHGGGAFGPEESSKRGAPSGFTEEEIRRLERFRGPLGGRDLDL